MKFAKVGRSNSDFLHGDCDYDRTTGFEGYPCGIADCWEIAT